ncbi:TapY2 family type IVa secretion system protein [Shewanella litorisediminis]|uniref:TapY2 family type IVa secretion system protein n=1 Tax=Shewanella litorisediminis TaxID=1173586 RepID=A0ABX7G5Y1_9GAMM|nr:TapY2 family type IVa secretion system protein [Shewanella litorisediminis]MCL2917550.1 TapY2 family type IVa secretion system protein [Shewanella litorisediminis]QRH02677.1 TapY2 family type IVa secretion system protein [Shewanella litorisediminis]
MNKTIAYLLFAFSLSSVAQVAHAAKQDYKCFVDSLPKGERVVFYRWDENEVQLKIARLPGTQLQDSNGKRVYIKSVEECVPLNTTFSSPKAQSVDKQTLR